MNETVSKFIPLSRQRRINVALRISGVVFFSYPRAENARDHKILAVLRLLICTPFPVRRYWSSPECAALAQSTCSETAFGIGTALLSQGTIIPGVCFASIITRETISSPVFLSISEKRKAAISSPDTPMYRAKQIASPSPTGHIRIYGISSCTSSSLSGSGYTVLFFGVTA